MSTPPPMARGSPSHMRLLAEESKTRPAASTAYYASEQDESRYIAASGVLERKEERQRDTPNRCRKKQSETEDRSKSGCAAVRETETGNHDQPADQPESDLCESIWWSGQDGSLCGLPHVNDLLRKQADLLRRPVRRIARIVTQPIAAEPRGKPAPSGASPSILESGGQVSVAGQSLSR
jgi:hypothetical protein